MVGRKNYPTNSVIATQKNAWIDEATFLKIVLQVWHPLDSGRNATVRLINMDSSHYTRDGKTVLLSRKTQTKLIYPGYKNATQVPNVSVNEPFKDYLHNVQGIFC